MAATLTHDGALTYVSFPIEKTDVNADGDLIVYGKATDGSVDHDQQIVSPEFSSKAISEWLATGGNLRVQHNPQRDPAGIGIEAHTDDSGATWVRSLVIEPVAKRLVSKGALRAYSVGIANPTIERDLTGKARGGIIKAGKIVEISLVDRPANPYCAFQLVKSMDDGLPEYVGKVLGADDVVQKMLHSVTGEISPTVFREEDFSVTFTPNDLARILQNKFVEKHYAELARDAAAYDPFRYSTLEKRDFDPGVGGGVDRDKLDESDFAGPHRSFPIVNESDVSDALRLVHHAADPAAVRARIHAIARRKGFSVPDDDSKEKSIAGALDSVMPLDDQSIKADDPDLTKTPSDPDNDGDDDTSPSGDTDHDAPFPPKKKGKKNKAAKTGKCMPSGTPQSASGAADAAPMDPMPDPSAYAETPMPAGRKAEEAAILRFKSIGMDVNLGRLHDLTCPAYDPEDVHAYHPHADFKSVIDESAFQRMAVNAAAGQPIAQAIKAQGAWQAAVTLKGADMADLNDYRAELHKAFRDANPGPSTYPSPGCVSPSKFNRPCLTDGRSRNGPGYGAPNTSPAVASSAPNARNFDRPPLSAGHQTPSPSFMKVSGEYPSEQGAPVRLVYAQMEKEQARQALLDMHEHISHMFPQACPMYTEKDPHIQPASRPVPPTEGIGKAAGADDLLVKARKKMKKKLGRKVLSGKMTVDEARAQLGRSVTQKAASPDVMSMNTVATLGKSVTLDIGKSITPDLMKHAMTQALQPVLDKIAEYDARFEKLASMTDPNTAPMAGIGIRKTTRPEGVITRTEAAERTQSMVTRELDKIARTSDNAAQREAARAALARYQGLY